MKITMENLNLYVPFPEDMKEMIYIFQQALGTVLPSRLIDTTP